MTQLCQQCSMSKGRECRTSVQITRLELTHRVLSRLACSTAQHRVSRSTLQYGGGRGHRPGKVEMYLSLLFCVISFCLCFHLHGLSLIHPSAHTHTILRSQSCDKLRLHLCILVLPCTGSVFACFKKDLSAMKHVSCHTCSRSLPAPCATSLVCLSNVRLCGWHVVH